MSREATQETARPGEAPNSALPTAEEVEGTQGELSEQRGKAGRTVHSLDQASPLPGPEAGRPAG